MNSCDLSQVFRKQPFVAFYAPSISAIKIETHQFFNILGILFLLTEIFGFFSVFHLFLIIRSCISKYLPFEPFGKFRYAYLYTKTKFSPSYGLPMKRYHKSAGKDDAYNEIFIADIKKSL